MKDPWLFIAALCLVIALGAYIFKAIDEIDFTFQRQKKLKPEDLTPIYYELIGLNLRSGDANKLAKSIYKTLSIEPTLIPFISRGDFGLTNYEYRIILTVDDKKYNILYNHSFQVVKYKSV